MSALPASTTKRGRGRPSHAARALEAAEASLGLRAGSTSQADVKLGQGHEAWYKQFFPSAAASSSSTTVTFRPVSVQTTEPAGPGQDCHLFAIFSMHVNQKALDQAFESQRPPATVVAARPPRSALASPGKRKRSDKKVRIQAVPTSKVARVTRSQPPATKKAFASRRKRIQLTAELLELSSSKLEALTTRDVVDLSLQLSGKEVSVTTAWKALQEAKKARYDHADAALEQCEDEEDADEEEAPARAPANKRVRLC